MGYCSYINHYYWYYCHPPTCFIEINAERASPSALRLARANLKRAAANFLKNFQKILDKTANLCYNNNTVKVPLSSKVIVAKIKATVVKGCPPLLYIMKER